MDPQGERFRKVLHKGLIKVMSKMGICAVTSYTGAGLFEILGLDADVVARFFPGVCTLGPGRQPGRPDRRRGRHHTDAAFGDLRATATALAGQDRAPRGMSRFWRGGRAGMEEREASRRRWSSRASSAIGRAAFLEQYEPKVFSTLPKVVNETEQEMACFLDYEQAPPEQFVPAFEHVLDEQARQRYAQWAAAINEREPITVAERYEIF